MSQMPERFGPTDNQTFAHHVQALYDLVSPNANIYHALSAELPVASLIETFHTASKDIDLWLEYANIAIFALELDVREGMSIKNVGEMDVLIHKFAPNIELLRELSQTILKQLNEPEEDNNRKDISDTFDRIHSDWVEAKTFFQKVKKEMSESKHRRELLDTMDQILASIEELNTNIFEYQEQRHSGLVGGSDNVTGEPFSFSETVSRSKPATAGGNSSANSEFSSRADVALMQLDSRLEPLSARIEYLRSRLSAPNAPSDPTGALSKKNKILSSKWDSLKREMESLREELKEDRWRTVFKQVSDQANQMMDSLDKAVRQCRDFISRATNRAESPLPLKQLQLRGMSIPTSRYNQQKSQQQSIQPPVAITPKNFQRLYKTFDAKRKYYVPAVTKMLTMLGNGINNEMTRDWDAINKYKSMKERWDNILAGVQEVQKDMPTLEAMMEASLISSNSPPSSLPSSITSSPPMSPSMRPIRGVFPPDSESPPPKHRPTSPYHVMKSSSDHERSLSPTYNNMKSPSLRSKSPSPRALSPYGSRQGYLGSSGRRSVSPPPPFPDKSWNHNHPPPSSQYYSPYSPTYNNHVGNSHRSSSPTSAYEVRNIRSKSNSRPGSPVRAPSVMASNRPMSPGDRVHASAIPRPVTSMGIVNRAASRMGARSHLPIPSTPQPGSAPRYSMVSPVPLANRRNPIRSPTPSSATSDLSRPMTPEHDEDDDDHDEVRSLSPSSETLHKMKVKEHPPYIPVKNDPLDVEVAKVVNASPITVKVERAPGGSGKYYFGSEGTGPGRKMYLCRLQTYSSSGRSKVTVRVGGGWTDLDMFLLEHGLLKDIGIRNVF